MAHVVTNVPVQFESGEDIQFEDGAPFYYDGSATVPPSEAFVELVTTSTGTAISTIPPNTVTKGSAILVAITQNGNSTQTYDCSDDQLNIYTDLTRYSISNRAVQFYYTIVEEDQPAQIQVAVAATSTGAFSITVVVIEPPTGHILAYDAHDGTTRAAGAAIHYSAPSPGLDAPMGVAIYAAGVMVTTGDHQVIPYPPLSSSYTKIAGPTNGIVMRKFSEHVLKDERAPWVTTSPITPASIGAIVTFKTVFVPHEHKFLRRTILTGGRLGFRGVKTGGQV